MKDFPPIYVITLREMEYRRVATQKHFERLGLYPQWFYGLNGQAAMLAPIVPHDRQNDGSYIYSHPSRIGNAVSHIFALERGISEAEEFFIMEDDVVLRDDFPNEWRFIRKHLPASIDVVQLATTHADNELKVPINEFFEHCCYPFCTACNWWSREGAMKTVKMLRPINTHIDVMMIQRVFPFLQHAITTKPIAWDHSCAGKDGRWPSAFNLMKVEKAQ